MRNRAGTIAAVLVLLATPVCFSAEWPQFRGPDRDGKSTETGLLKKWPEEGPELLWSADGLGTGFSSVAIADGCVYTTGMSAKNKQGILFACDVEGNLRWKASYGPEWSGSHPGARTTPTVDGDRIYVISGYGNLVCFDAKTGSKNWEVDVLARFQGQNTNWGISESVLISVDKVICTPGGADATVAALDKMTGQTIWTSTGLSDKSAHCSPILIETGEKKLIVTVTAASIVGIDEANGTVVWRYGNKLRKGKPRHVNPNSPTYLDGGLYVTSRFVGGVKLKILKGATGISQVWMDDRLDPHHGGVVLVDGYIYGSSSKDENWMCLDWQTGGIMYERKWIGKGSIVYADDMLYCYEEKKGTVALVKTSPGGFDIVSSFEVTLGTGEHWAHPVICDGRLYIRHGDVLMVYDINAG